MQLDALLHKAGLPATGCHVEIRRICFDSRKVRHGDLFVAIDGVALDGHRFIGDACRNGAVAIVASRPVPAPPPVVVVPDTRRALSALADAWFDHPARQLQITGITGTKGKTTTSYLLRSILETAGRRTGLLGTIACELLDTSLPAHTTTPDPLRLHELLARLVAQHAHAAVMEVSSHALTQHRTEHVAFDVAVFTNLSGEHLDYHRDMHRYLEAKARLFDTLAPTATAAIHTPGPWCPRLEQTPARTLRYGAPGRRRTRPPLDLRATAIRTSAHSTRFTLQLPDGSRHRVRLQLLGRHNVENALAAASAAWALGVDAPSICAGLERLEHVPGRLEPVRAGQPFTVLVDYAHTDDALRRVLETLQSIRRPGARIHCVFGCGGDRDRTKRPRMARAAESGADHVVLTSDNPRTEDPERIARDALAGFRNPDAVTVELDRAAAIATALRNAQPGDIVLIAGKGHETVQIVGSERRPFDDREVARAALRRRHPHTPRHAHPRPAQPRPTPENHA